MKILGSLELKAQVSFSDHLSLICLSIHLSVNFFFIFDFIPISNHWANFNYSSVLPQNILGWSYGVIDWNFSQDSDVAHDFIVFILTIITITTELI